MLPTYFRASGQIYDLLNFNLHFLLMEVLLKLTATIQESGKLTHLIDKLALLNICSSSNFTICMEIQTTSNSQSNLEKEEWNWRNQPA